MYEKFSKLLELKKVKVSDVCAATGIAQGTFSDWKSGRSSPKIDKLKKIAAYFGVSPNYFFEPDEIDVSLQVYLTDPNIKRMVLFAGQKIPAEQRERFLEALIKTYEILEGRK